MSDVGVQEQRRLLAGCRDTTFSTAGLQKPHVDFCTKGDGTIPAKGLYSLVFCPARGQPPNMLCNSFLYRCNRMASESFDLVPSAQAFGILVRQKLEDSCGYLASILVLAVVVGSVHCLNRFLAGETPGEIQSISPPS